MTSGGLAPPGGGLDRGRRTARARLRRGGRPGPRDRGAGCGGDTPLHVHAWGDEGAPRVVCLHGVTAVGRALRASSRERLAATRRVLAPDLLGHGASPYEPPWRIDDHLDALAGDRRRRAARRGSATPSAAASRSSAPHGSPSSVERLVLLDPAIAAAAARRALGGRERPGRAALRQLRGGDRPPLRRERAARRAAGARRGRASRPPRRARRTAGATATPRRRSSRPTRRWPRRRRRSHAVRVPTLLVLGAELVPPLRPPARRASRCARRPARGRHRPRRAHRALGRARRDRRGDPALPATCAVRVYPT